jgi:HPt (histidine-containing phosphotransfer) domain-containing protein
MGYKFINSEYLDSVSGGDPDLVNELVTMFKEQSREIYDEMNKLLAEKNFSMLGLLAHKAKSSVAIMGMNSLADMLKTFEHQAKEGKDQHLYESYLKRFKTETDGAVRELEDLITKM